jgi:ribonuclease D
MPPASVFIQRHPTPQSGMPPHRTPPQKADIAQLEPFEGIEVESIFVVGDARQAKIAVEDLLRCGRVGFDTESKPTFHKGQVSEGPHVLQFATTEKVYIFQSHCEESHPFIVELLKSTQLVKIGFGLDGDLHQIAQRFGIRPGSIVDLDRSFRNLGYRNAVGAKSAIAILFNRKFLKSKSVTTSNWALPHLSERQLVYAANDAYAAIRVFHALEALKKEDTQS